MLKDAFEWGKEEWKEDPEAAYAEAERRIAWARAHREEPWLFLSDILALRQLPPTLADCAHIKRLSLGDETGPDGVGYGQPGDDRYKIEDWSPLAALPNLIRGDFAYSNLKNLTPLSGATGLQSLNLVGTGVIDLTPLIGATGLQSLNLRRTGVSDLTPLIGATGLQSLNLGGTGVSDLTPLIGATGLQSLDLTGTGVIDLTPLIGATGLQSLNLGDTGVSDLTPLIGATGLQNLDLWNTGVIDLSPLSGATGLQSLNLGDTGVSDLTPLIGATGLQSLNLWGAGVSDLSPLLANPAFTAAEPMELCIGETRLAQKEGWTDLDHGSIDMKTTRAAVAKLLQEGHEIPPPSRSDAKPRPERYVFISYAREDWLQVNAICEALSARDIPFWCDIRDGEPGADVSDMLERAIDGAAAVLPLWSPTSCDSVYVKAEAERAHQQSKLVPALMEPCAPPIPFSQINTIDLTDWRPGEASEAFDRLAQILKFRLGAELSQVEATEGPDGRIGLSQRPVNRRPADDDAARRVAALDAQKRLADDIVADAQFEAEDLRNNVDRRLIYYVGKYADALAEALGQAREGALPVWQPLDQRFLQVRPLTKDDGLRDGARAQLAALETAHDVLEAKLRPDQTGQKPEVEDTVAPDEAAVVVDDLRAVRGYLPKEHFMDEVADFIDEQAQIISDEARDPPEIGAPSVFTRVGRAVRSALGVVGTIGAILGAAAGVHSWALTGGPASALSFLTRLFDSLMKLLPG